MHIICVRVCVYTIYVCIRVVVCQVAVLTLLTGHSETLPPPGGCLPPSQPQMSRNSFQNSFVFPSFWSTQKVRVIIVYVCVYV